MAYTAMAYIVVAYIFVARNRTCVRGVSKSLAFSGENELLVMANTVLAYMVMTNIAMANIAM